MTEDRRDTLPADELEEVGWEVDGSEGGLAGSAPGDDPGSVTLSVRELEAGDDSAAQFLWDRYIARLTALARNNLKARARGGVSDEEDVALMAFHNLCSGVSRGRFPKLRDRDDLWRLLVALTNRRAADELRHRGRLKQGGGRVLSEADLLGADADGLKDARGIDQQVGDAPTPEFLAMVGEETRRLLDCLGDDDRRYRQIALWKMEGYTSQEIADRLGCSLKTVANRLADIRRIWLERGVEGP